MAATFLSSVRSELQELAGPLRGFAHAAKWQYDSAIKDYDSAIALDPRHTTAFNNRAAAHEANGDIERAIADFRRALAIGGNQFSRDALERLGASP